MMFSCPSAESWQLDITPDNHFPEDGTVEQEAVALLDRVFVITLVLLAIIVLV